MSYLTERAAYLKGLAEGLKFDETSNEGKLFNAMIDVITELADEVELLEDRVEELAYEVEDFGDEDYFDDEDEELDYFEVECEKCGNIIYIDEDIMDSDDEIKCPKCGELIEIEFESCEDCESCGLDCCSCSDDE